MSTHLFWMAVFDSRPIKTRDSRFWHARTNFVYTPFNFKGPAYILKSQVIIRNMPRSGVCCCHLWRDEDCEQMKNRKKQVTEFSTMQNPSVDIVCIFIEGIFAASYGWFYTCLFCRTQNWKGLMLVRRINDPKWLDFSRWNFQGHQIHDFKTHTLGA